MVGDYLDERLRYGFDHTITVDSRVSTADRNYRDLGSSAGTDAGIG